MNFYGCDRLFWFFFHAFAKISRHKNSLKFYSILLLLSFELCAHSVCRMVWLLMNCIVSLRLLKRSSHLYVWWWTSIRSLLAISTPNNATMWRTRWNPCTVLMLMVLLSIVDLSVKKAFGHLKLCADLTLDFPFLLFMFVIHRSTKMGMHCSFGVFLSLYLFRLPQVDVSAKNKNVSKWEKTPLIGSLKSNNQVITRFVRSKSLIIMHWHFMQNDWEKE